MQATKRSLDFIGDQIVFDTGRHTITVQWVRDAVYTVTVYQGTLRLDDLCTSFTHEGPARLLARWYAELFQAEAVSELAGGCGVVIEPANHTALVDYYGDTWIRVDELPGQYGTWWPLCDGPGWESWPRGDVGQAREWPQVEEYGPFVEADPERSAHALTTVTSAVTA